MLETNEIAHISKDSDGLWRAPHFLGEHLQSVAALAAEFAEAFDSSSWAKLAGLTHDLGKSTQEWQSYIREKSGYESEEVESDIHTQDHSSPSALFVEQMFPNHIGRLLSYSIAGHHTGLPDWQGSQASLLFRLQHAKKAASTIPPNYMASIKPITIDPLPWTFDAGELGLSFWIRMIFSCLVDADFLDTEQYMDKDSSNVRSEFYSIPHLLESYNSYMDSLVIQSQENEISHVNQMRRMVLSECRKAAELIPGLFSLTVPTGGGKTLASLGFALEHAKRYNKKRIIYVIPYTSIIEQTAEVFRKVLGSEQVIEHHSNFDSDHTSKKIRLASENWDAPIVVTTNVQFLESLFSSRPGRCRKLHNIVNSVVIFDEAQLFPTDFLHPILDSLKELVFHYHTSLLFCTATQPAFEKNDRFPSFPGFEKEQVREIISDVPFLYKQLVRVEIQTCENQTEVTWSDLATTLSSYEKVLCIVSDRKSCRELYQLMPEGTIHLSALMCPQHRSDVIRLIKETLKTEKPLRVITTQLVEAGVDIDFPVVYRAMAGVDSIVQAAGRCNREGKLHNSLGKVVLFTPPRKPPIGILRKSTEITRMLIKNQEIDFNDPSLYRRYFETLYWKSNSLDSKFVMEMLKPERLTLGIQFRSASQAFTIIDDAATESILIPYKEGQKLIRKLETHCHDQEGSARGLFRKLQRYSVTIYKNQFQAMLKQGLLIEVYPKVFALQCEVGYSNSVGLLVDDIPFEPATYCR